MAGIKPAEVSAILREQLSSFKTEAELEEVGTILQVGDGIARIYGLSAVQYGELIEFEGGLQGIALNLEEDNVGAVLLGSSSSLKEGDTVKRTGKIASVKLEKECLAVLLTPWVAQLMEKDRLKVTYTKCLSSVKLLVLFIASQLPNHYSQELKQSTQ